MLESTVRFGLLDEDDELPLRTGEIIGSSSAFDLPFCSLSFNRAGVVNQEILLSKLLPLDTMSPLPVRLFETLYGQGSFISSDTSAYKEEGNTGLFPPTGYNKAHWPKKGAEFKSRLG